MRGGPSGESLVRTRAGPSGQSLARSEARAPSPHVPDDTGDEISTDEFIDEPDMPSMYAGIPFLNFDLRMKNTQYLCSLQ